MSDQTNKPNNQSAGGVIWAGLAVPVVVAEDLEDVTYLTVYRTTSFAFIKCKDLQPLHYELLLKYAAMGMYFYGSFSIPDIDLTVRFVASNGELYIRLGSKADTEMPSLGDIVNTDSAENRRRIVLRTMMEVFNALL
jgi:hypothetical protein